MEHEQQIWGECARLITNCITIYYNAMLLSNLLKQVSPVAWQHFDLYGAASFAEGRRRST